MAAPAGLRWMYLAGRPTGTRLASTLALQFGDCFNPRFFGGKK